MSYFIHKELANDPIIAKRRAVGRLMELKITLLQAIRNGQFTVKIEEGKNIKTAELLIEVERELRKLGLKNVILSTNPNRDNNRYNRLSFDAGAESYIIGTLVKPYIFPSQTEEEEKEKKE